MARSFFRRTKKDLLAKIIQVKILTIFLFLIISLQARVNQEGDFQIWTREYVTHRLQKKCSLWFLAEQRFGNHASEFYAYIFQGQLNYNVYPWLTIGPGYRQAWVRNPRITPWHLLYIPFAQVGLRAHLKGWELQNRNRIEYVMDSIQNFWVDRNRIRLLTPSFIKNGRVFLFVDDEIFLSQGKGLGENRASFGLKAAWLSHWEGEVFFTARFNKNTDHKWIYNSIMNFTMMFHF